MFCRFHPPGQATASKTVYENCPPNSTHRAQALLFHNRKFSPARSCFRLAGTLAQTGRLGGKRGKRGKRWKRWKMRILPIRRKGMDRHGNNFMRTAGKLRGAEYPYRKNPDYHTVRTVGVCSSRSSRHSTSNCTHEGSPHL